MSTTATAASATPSIEKAGAAAAVAGRSKIVAPIDASFSRSVSGGSDAGTVREDATGAAGPNGACVLVVGKKTKSGFFGD